MNKALGKGAQSYILRIRFSAKLMSLQIIESISKEIRKQGAVGAKILERKLRMLSSDKLII